MAIVEEIVEEDDVLSRVDKLKTEGNAAFAQGNYDDALIKYKEGIELCPVESSLPRALLFSNLAATCIKKELWQEAADHANSAIEAGVPNDKALERRAFAHSQISGKYENAIEDYKLLLEKDPQRKDVPRKIVEIEAKIQKRNEDLKNDMIEKLKGLGNVCLRPFGLSTDSFQLQPNGDGGYSVSMKNNTGTTQQ